MAFWKCIHLGAIRSHLLAGELVVRPVFSCLTHGCMCSPPLTSPSSALHTNAVERLHGTGSTNWQSRWPSLMQGVPEKGVLYRAKWTRHLQLMVRYRSGSFWVTPARHSGVTVSSFVSDSHKLSEEEFHSTADETLNQLQEKIEAYGEELNVDGFDVDFSDGVLTVRLGDLGTYVINKQTPNRQLWLSSPVSGPARFDWNGTKAVWVYRRTKAELVSLLEQELSKLLGSPFTLKD